MNIYKWGNNWRIYDSKNNILNSLNNSNGLIRIYNTNSKLAFECEYLNGGKNGKVKKKYYKNCNLIIEGGYLESKKNGKSK